MTRKMPEIIEVNSRQLEELLERAASNTLREEDTELITHVFDSYMHLFEIVGDKSTTIARLRKLFFGANSEKSEKILGEQEDAEAALAPGSDNGESHQASSEPEEDEDTDKEPSPGHGRHGAGDYQGATQVDVPHPTLCAGDDCPCCEQGTVYEKSPRVFVRFVGQAPLHATVYRLQRLRCNLCGKVFTAPAPEEMGAQKYDHTSSLPAVGIQVQALRGWVGIAIAVVLLLGLCAGIVFVEQGQRRIPVNFAKRVVGRRQYGGNNTYIPLKVNQAGVIPVIFASSLLSLPTLLTGVLPADGWGQSVRDFIDRNLFRPDNVGYILIFGLLIVGFAYFYNSIAFDPIRRAEDLRKSGGFIPGIRPGPQTERHLAKILNRITLPGALFLAVVALIPSAALARYVGGGTGSTNITAFSGVSILIGVGVSLETMKQIDSQLMSRNYEGFLK